MKPSDSPASRPPDPVEVAATPARQPGDEVPPGTPQSAEDVCARCAGSGWIDAGPCPDCKGSGRVTVNVGDA